MSLTDTMGSLVMATKGYCSNTMFLMCCSALTPLTGMTGVSTDISVSFVHPAGRPGDIVYDMSHLTGMGTYHIVSPCT